MLNKETYEAEAQSEAEEKEKEDKTAKAGRNPASQGLEGNDTEFYFTLKP